MIQERDRLGLAIVGMNRVVREKSLQAVLFPGRDDATFANRVWELARELDPVGAYWRVHRRTREDGLVERYLSLTDVGYRQAEVVLGANWFQRKPTEELRPSHILHDLELADLALELLPRRVGDYQPKHRGQPSGPPVHVQVPYLAQNWRWFHSSVFRRLTVLDRARDEVGRPVGRPRVLLAYEPDAILETDAGDCARYFIELDRGTEPLAGAKERRSISDKLRRIDEYFWVARGGRRPGQHWAQRDSYYLEAFPGGELRRPRCLFLTTSAKRAENIRRLAAEYFRDLFSEAQLPRFLAVLTMEEARRKLSSVTLAAESAPRPVERPWVRELREIAAAEAAAKAREAERERRLAAAAAAEEARQRAEKEKARSRMMTWEQVQQREREEQEAERRRRTVFGKIKGFVVGR